MTRSIRPRLYDIDANIDVVLARVAGRQPEDLATDLDLRYVLLHAFMIIAEAANKLPEPVRQQSPQVPWQDIIGMGTKIKHEYHRIDLNILWDAATVHLPTLRPIVKQLLVNTENTLAPV
ncbi:HepT-like ribonuclease domain-containing protein [Hyphomicrobium sp. NDB2Meth4]|uniref:HepT-like ribonuclease domain-containing protein n=1 Tax=Hyphomicrobium sp. NDB2Meth4 TaxID=1892846 RepID=UPI000A7E3920|nr:HepT-like ribonuclease domain-containing protein [Hyphomicrobium sp. NDB2Meth4]